MAFAGADVTDEEKKTGYTFKGMPLILSKTRGRPPSGKMAVGKPGWWSEKKRIEAITLFAATGNASKVEELSGVPKATVSKWIKEDWGKDLLSEIRDENDHQIDARFTGIVLSALDQLTDRIDNGDHKVLKGGKVVRVPVGARDLALVTAINVEKRQLLRGRPTSRSETVSEGSRLKRLEEAFTKLAETKRAKPLVIEDAEYSEVKKEDVESS